MTICTVEIVVSVAFYLLISTIGSFPFKDPDPALARSFSLRNGFGHIPRPVFNDPDSELYNLQYYPVSLSQRKVSFVLSPLSLPSPVSDMVILELEGTHHASGSQILVSFSCYRTYLPKLATYFFLTAAVEMLTTQIPS